MTAEQNEYGEPWKVIDRRNAPLKNIRIESCAGMPVGEVHHVHQRDYQGLFRGDHAAANAIDAIGLAHAARIVAAVNAVAGMSVPAPPSEVEGGK